MSVGISTTLCENIDQVINMIEFIRGYRPDIKIILGGPFIVEYVRAYSPHGTDILNRSLKKVNADFIIDSFYGEDTLSEIVTRIKNGTPINDIPNIYYRDNNVYFYSQKGSEDIYLDRSTVDWSLFANRIGNSVSVRTSTSCKFSCAFCNYRINAGKYQCLSVDDIEKDLDAIQMLGKVEYVNFIDDTLNVPIKRFKEILHMMIKKKYSFKWYSFIRCQYLDAEAVELMKKSGCIGVILGIESGNDEVLKIMNKQTTVDAYKRGIGLLNQFDITIYASFIIGFPGETIDTVKDTISFINETKLKFYVMRPWFYDTRTPISEQSEKYQLTGSFESWRHSTMDSATAIKLTEEAKQTIHSSIYAFNNYVVIFQAISNGLNLNQIEEYLKIINERN